jgi:hypothetical protein
MGIMERRDDLARLFYSIFIILRGVSTIFEWAVWQPCPFVPKIL